MTDRTTSVATPTTPDPVRSTTVFFASAGEVAETVGRIVMVTDVDLREWHPGW